MAKTKVKIPVNIPELLTLCDRVLEKHVADGPDSKLHALVDFSWDSLAPDVPACRQEHEDGVRLRRESQRLIADRNRKVKVLREALRATRDFLEGVYRSHPRHLGEWGFEVTKSSPSKSKAKE